MHPLSTLLRSPTAILVVLLLSACGGGGGDGPRVRADPQSLAFDAAPALQVGASAAVIARASSGLAVTLASLTPGVCGVDSAGTVRGMAIGRCSIRASQGGNERYAPAPQATLDFAVDGRAQRIRFAALPALTVARRVSLDASADSALPVHYTSLTPDICSVDAEAGSARGLAGGDCVIAADQPGDTQWAAAPRATRSAEVVRRGQDIRFDGLPALRAGTTATAQASAGSGLTLAFSTLTPEVCEVGAGTGLITALAAGTCRVAADQAGDAQWAPAARVTRSATIGLPEQVVAFIAPPASLVVDGTAPLRANASSGLAVRYSSQSASICSVDAVGGQVRGLAIGSCTVAADQDGNASWAAAAQARVTLPVHGIPQAVRFAAAPTLVTGGTATVRATADSALPVRYSSLTPANCTVNAGNGLVKSLAAGACKVSADQAGDARWAAAAQATLNLGTAGAGQTLVFGSAPALAVDGTATLQAIASSGLAVSYTSLTPATCRVDATSGVAGGLAIGFCTVSANQAGDAAWAPAAQVTQSLQVAGLAQRITFGAAPALAPGGTATVRATARSGLPVAYSSLSATVCSVEAASGLVTSRSAGACTIAASQPGNTRWAAAPQVVQTLGASVSSQTMSFDTAPAPLTVGGTATVRARASSGLAVAYSSLSPAVCSVGVGAGAGMVTALAAGSCMVAANQAGNATWAPAAQVVQTLAVSGIAQTVSFGAAPGLVAGGSASVRASASSGLAVAYASLTSAVCSVHPASGLVSGSAAGSCSITADQPGNGRFAVAPQAVQTFGVAAAAQTLSFAAASALAVGGTGTVRATASSGLAVQYSSLSSSTCSVQAGSGVVSALAVGPCTIAADQAGNAQWAAAPRATKTLAVAGQAQSLSFGAAPALVVGGGGIVRATASSGLAVTYGSTTPAVCSVGAGSGLLSGLATGSCRVTASQPGDSRWAAAPTASQTITVAANPNQTLNFMVAPTLTLGGTATVRANASSGLPVAYSSLSASVCDVQPASGLVTGLSLGDCVIAADQPGDATFLPAAQVRQTLPVQVPAGVTVPRAPLGVAARLGANASTVVLSIASVDSGGSPVTGYTVVSRPAGLLVDATTAPVTVTCPAGCAGLAFSIRARNALGAGEASAAVDVKTTFDVLTTFREPDTQPRDTLFTGSFVLNSTTGAISGLSGQLTESMTGNAVGDAPFYDMTQVSLAHQLKTWSDPALGGSFVAAFAKNTLSTFTMLAGGDGWSPEAGIANGGIYAGFPGPHAASTQNSYVLIFVPNDPFAVLTPAQIDELAYADCAPGGMMGAVCMTATSIGGHGSTGTMSGYPVSQVIRRR